MEYAEESFVEMVPEKTKLLCFTPSGQEMVSYYWSVARPVSLLGHSISFTDKAEHVGILRSTQPGNMPNILERQSAHTRAIFSLLPAGLG